MKDIIFLIRLKVASHVWLFHKFVSHHWNQSIFKNIVDQKVSQFKCERPKCKQNMFKNQIFNYYFGHKKILNVQLYSILFFCMYRPYWPVSMACISVLKLGDFAMTIEQQLIYFCNYTCKNAIEESTLTVLVLWWLQNPKSKLHLDKFYTTLLIFLRPAIAQQLKGLWE